MDTKWLAILLVSSILFGLISARNLDAEAFLKRAWNKHKLHQRVMNALKTKNAANLAVRTIDEGRPGCFFTTECNGRGVFDSDSCACVCDEGFYGPDCEDSCSCEDIPGYDWACPHWEHLCSDSHFGDFLTEACRGTCHLCNPPPGAC